MIFDKFLIENLSNFMGVNESPKNLDEVYSIFENISNGLENNDLKSQLIGNVFYYFISAKEIRDRKVSSRVFEDLIASLLKGTVLDEESKPNPLIPDYIFEYDTIFEEQCLHFKFSIAQDLAGNKREKADNKFGDYSLSIKTLKGKLYDEELKAIDNSYNKELNIGSLSYRALLVGLLSRDELLALSDRKGGLGSKGQLIKSIYNPLKENNQWDNFINRLEKFLKYVYSGSDFLIVFKSGYKMELVFIKEEDFIDELIAIAREDYDTFFSVFYRWENNNLRIHYSTLFERLEDKNKIKKITLKFDKSVKNYELKIKINKIKEFIKESFDI
ncbi:MAG: hypothetical protein ACRDAG_06735 [Cetobacterium somerae]|uniref:hypothetical protein n=1 Tax=Cetobacterium somerae TaxID=188913 RepID=UPI003F3D2009